MIQNGYAKLAPQMMQKGLRDRNSPYCTLSQNGYGDCYVLMSTNASSTKGCVCLSCDLSMAAICALLRSAHCLHMSNHPPMFWFWIVSNWEVSQLPITLWGLGDVV